MADLIRIISYFTRTFADIALDDSGWQSSDWRSSYFIANSSADESRWIRVYLRRVPFSNCPINVYHIEGTLRTTCITHTEREKDSERDEINIRNWRYIIDWTDLICELNWTDRSEWEPMGCYICPTATVTMSGTVFLATPAPPPHPSLCPYAPWLTH